MSKKTLPTKLGKEPLVDVVFQVRFESTVSAADVLPGFLHSKLEGKNRIERMPISTIPLEIRQQDSQLMNQPLIRMFWDNYIIMMGDKSVAIGCVLPYRGWTAFRETIIKLMNHLEDAAIVSSVERYSMKYVDILQIDGGPSAPDWLDMNFTLGGHKLGDRSFKLSLEVPGDSVVHSLLVGAPAKAATLDGSVREGLLVSVDSISQGEMPTLKQLLIELPQRLEAIHQQNKQTFFDCLTDVAIQNLEPKYE